MEGATRVTVGTLEVIETVSRLNNGVERECLLAGTAYES
jgi:hypothetical protein